MDGNIQSSHDGFSSLPKQLLKSCKGQVTPLIGHGRICQFWMLYRPHYIRYIERPIFTQLLLILLFQLAEFALRDVLNNDSSDSRYYRHQGKLAP
eukprot:scaffold172173_cov46-Prasinocladus_malaysianus.AAC.1